MSNRIARLRWRCRRGTKELDILLGRFLDRGYQDLDDAEQATFERLLDEQDDRLQSWFLGVERPADKEVAALVDRILRTPSG